MCIWPSSATPRAAPRSPVPRAGWRCSRMSDRDVAMRDFLKSAGWGDAVLTPLPGDASTRRYFRVAHGSRKAMLMDQPQGAEQPTAPANATPDERRALGYNAIA